MSRIGTSRTLTIVWIGLLLLLTLTTASSFINLGAGNSIINLVIAAAKVALIATYYMHLRYSDNAVRAAAGAALLFLFILAFLSFGDFLTRSMHPAPWMTPAEPLGLRHER